MFAKLYQHCYQKYFLHPKAMHFLGFFAFIEAIFFPIPVDAFLIMVVLANAKKYVRAFLICTLFSVGGGVVGYGLGWFLYELFEQTITHSFLAPSFEKVGAFLHQFDTYAILIAAFTPLPFKVFALLAGHFKINILIFVLFSLIGRGLRFFIVAILVKYTSKQLHQLLLKYLDWIGWIVILGVGIYAFYYFT